MLTIRSLAWRLLRLAGPVALARLGIMAMSVVDVMVVGQYVPAELPHLALGWAPTSVLLVAGIGLLTGVQVLAARAFGAGELRAAGSAWRRGNLIALLAGLAAIGAVWLLGARSFTAFGISQDLAVPSAAVARILVLSVPLHFIYVAAALFLESIQRPLASMLVMWGANAVNLALNVALVPEFGAVGSAWATFGARVCLAVALVVWVYRSDGATELGIRGPLLGPSTRNLLGVGIAACVSQAAEAGAFSGMTMIAGRLGPSAVSAYQILLNLLATMFMGALGLASAAAVLTGEAVGRRDAVGATRSGFVSLALSALFALAAGVLVVVFASRVGRAYTADAPLAAQVAASLWLAALVMPPDAGQVVVSASLRARGDNWFPTASHLLAYAAVMPVLGVWLAESRGYGVNGLLVAILSASLLSCGVLSLRLWAIQKALPRVGAP